MKLLQGALIALMLSSSLMANTNEEKAKQIFSQKFKVIRTNDAKIMAVVIKMNTKNFSAEAMLRDLITEIKSINRQAKNKLQNNSTSYAIQSVDSASTQYEMEMDQTMQGIYGEYETELVGKDDAQYINAGRDVRLQQLRLAMEAVQNDEVAVEMASVEKSEAWKKFKEKLGEVLLRIRPDVLSVPLDQKYFFQRQLITQLSKIIVEQVAKKSPSKIVHLIAEVFSQVEGMIADQRMFNQNFLLYLLENHKAASFGLEEKEVSAIVSSIYQSRLGLQQLIQMKKMAEGDWESYGWNSFYTQKRTANATLEKFEKTIYVGKETKRIGSAFAMVTEDEHRKIVNLFNKAHMFSSKPSLAYDFEKPNKVKITRLVVRLAKFGVGFIPMPSAIKSFANNFADSTYKEQVLTEGALSAYFMVNGHEALSAYFAKQTLNPFLR